MAAFAALLALTDYSTPCCCSMNIGGWAMRCAFHTGAPLTLDLARAVFAYLHMRDPCRRSYPSRLATPKTPENGAMLFIRVDSLEHGNAMTWRGPGYRDQQTAHIAGVPGFVLDDVHCWRASFLAASTVIRAWRIGYRLAAHDSRGGA